MQTIKNANIMKTARPYILWIIFAAWMLLILAAVILFEYKF